MPPVCDWWWLLIFDSSIGVALAKYAATKQAISVMLFVNSSYLLLNSHFTI